MQQINQPSKRVKLSQIASVLSRWLLEHYSRVYTLNLGTNRLSLLQFIYSANTNTTSNVLALYILVQSMSLQSHGREIGCNYTIKSVIRN